MSITFCPLFSGSSGNAIFVQAGHTRLLIDAGLSGRVITGALESIGVDPQTLDAILITHEHSDHVKGAGILSRKYHLPIYATGPTWQAMSPALGEVMPRNWREFEPQEDFYVKDICVAPFPIPHDAACPVGFRLYFGQQSVAVATDLGRFTRDTLNRLAGSNMLLLESNHDPEMLLNNPRYSQTLKKRILGNRGHLSNESCATALEMLVNTGVNHVVLGHLSQENNLPELAHHTSCQQLRRMGLTPGRDVMVDMAWRDRVGKVYTLTDGMCAGA